jgi:hypothetical protein
LSRARSAPQTANLSPITRRVTEQQRFDHERGVDVAQIRSRLYVSHSQ